jgi:hypothetical protein
VDEGDPMTGDPALGVRIQELGITRLCHLTPTRNFVHIAAEGNGLLSITQLNNEARAVFQQQDMNRWDGHPDHISCSIQYPNAWYLRKKKVAFGEAANFPDWTMLGIHPCHLLREDTLFCPQNAAKGSGAGLRGGLAGFEALYEKDGPYPRSPDRIAACPSNDQAEAMIYQRIPLDDITTIFVPNAEQAARQYVQLEAIGVDPNAFGYVIAPTFFEAYSLSTEMRNGTPPSETDWNPPA